MAGWVLGIDPVDFKKLGNVSFIVIGVVLASFGEINFVMIGFIYQLGGIIFEAVRICMVQRLLNGAEFKMDPLVSLYYFAPVCAVMNLTVALLWEVPRISMTEVYTVGISTFFANACCAFLLNVSVVFLVGAVRMLSNSPLTYLSDRKDVWSCSHAVWCAEGHSSCRRFNDYLGDSNFWSSSFWLYHSSWWYDILQIGAKRAQATYF